MTTNTILTRLALLLLASGATLTACNSEDPDSGAGGNGDDNQNTGNNDQTPGCGDGVLAANEQCDIADLGGATCASIGFDGGVLACRTNCTYDTLDCTAPPNCGNGSLDPGEACDGNQLGGSTCGSAGFATGTVTCNPNCTLDATACYTCGNAQVEGPEACDGDSMNSESCESMQHSGGELSCSQNCMTFDESSCTDCGNSVIEDGEDCEPGTIVAACEDLNFSIGTVGCNPTSCKYDTSACLTSCNDGIDNDDDNVSDFPGDAGCTSVDDNNELIWADSCNGIAGSYIYDVTVEEDTYFVGSTINTPTGFAGTCAPNAPAGTIILYYRARAAKTVHFDLGNHFLGFPDFDDTNYDTVIYVREGLCTGPELACQDDKEPFIDLASEVTVTMQANTDYFIFIGGYTAGSFGLDLDIQ